MPDNRTFHVLDEDGDMVTSLGTRYDQAGAEHYAEGHSRRATGTFTVVPAGGGRAVSKFKNGKKVK